VRVIYWSICRVNTECGTVWHLNLIWMTFTLRSKWHLRTLMTKKAADIIRYAMATTNLIKNVSMGLVMLLLISRPWVNFINMFICSFYTQRYQKWKKCSQSSMSFCTFVIFEKKAARKMLVKLIPVFNFINVLWAAFTHTDPKCTKKTVISVFRCFCDLQEKSCS